MGSESGRLPPQHAGRDVASPGLRVLRDPHKRCPLSHSPNPAYPSSQLDLCAPGTAGAGNKTHSPFFTFSSRQVDKEE